MPRRDLVDADFTRRRALNLPENARFDVILKAPKDGNLGAALTAAMEAIEAAFPPLAGQLPKDYGRFEGGVLEEMMRMLAESGHLGGEVPALAIPTNLSALIGARLDALPAGERRTAQHSSVVGGVFWSSAVAKLEQGDADVSANLAALGRRDLIQERETSSVAGEREWAFKHILIRDVAYTRVPKARRAALHTRCADWIGALPAGADEGEVEFGFHGRKRSVAIRLSF